MLSNRGISRQKQWPVGICSWDHRACAPEGQRFMMRGDMTPIIHDDVQNSAYTWAELEFFPFLSLPCLQISSEVHHVLRIVVFLYKVIVLNFLYSSFKGATYTIRSGIEKMLLNCCSRVSTLFTNTLRFPLSILKWLFYSLFLLVIINVSFLTYYRWDDQTFQV